jgi:hypothetical protein
MATAIARANADPSPLRRVRNDKDGSLIARNAHGRAVYGDAEMLLTPAWRCLEDFAALDFARVLLDDL